MDRHWIQENLLKIVMVAVAESYSLVVCVIVVVAVAAVADPAAVDAVVGTERAELAAAAAASFADVEAVADAADLELQRRGCRSSEGTDHLLPAFAP